MVRERSDEAEAWFAAVYQAIQEIPYGKVCSYGHIARLLDRPECPRQVGVCLKHLPHEGTGHIFHEGNVPWQRVINAKGEISPRGPGSASRQAEALRVEGVEVGRGSLGQYTVDFAVYGWFPDELRGQCFTEPAGV